jgi:hypothetical protein
MKTPIAFSTKVLKRMFTSDEEFDDFLKAYDQHRMRAPRNSWQPKGRHWDLFQKAVQLAEEKPGETVNNIAREAYLSAHEIDKLPDNKNPYKILIDIGRMAIINAQDLARDNASSTN